MFEYQNKFFGDVRKNWSITVIFLIVIVIVVMCVICVNAVFVILTIIIVDVIVDVVFLLIGVGGSMLTRRKNVENVMHNNGRVSPKVYVA